MFNRIPGGSGARAGRAAEVLNQNPSGVAADEVRLFISAAQDLIERLESISSDPEVRRLRSRTGTALKGARAAFAEGGQRVRDRAGEIADYGQIYVRRHPWTTLGAVAVGLLAIGLWTSHSLTD